MNTLVHPPPRSLHGLGLLLLAWCAWLAVVRGVIPALSRVDTDFPNYYTSARIALEGGAVERFYDDAWFQEQIHRHGMDELGQFSPFPPPTALLLMPLARLQPLTALRIVTVVSLLSLAVAIVLLARILQWRAWTAALFVLLSGHAIHTGLRFGQPYILMSALCILGYYLYQKGRPVLAGVVLAVFVPIKYFPATVIGCMALQRQWRVLLASSATVLAISLLSVAILGWPVHRTFLMAVFGVHLTGQLGLPLSATVQSFDTLFGQLFLYDPVWNPSPLRASATLQWVFTTGLKAAVLLTTAATLVRLAGMRGRDALPPAIGIVGLAALLVAPGTATYHFVVLWLPVGLLLIAMRSAPLLWGLTLGLYACLGFIPYGLVARFSERGWLTPLAFPRLWVLVALFVVAVYWAWTHSPSIQGAAHPVQRAAQSSVAAISPPSRFGSGQARS
ncbi:MAG TPA: glycosyltransferase family 87 protein [Steroidobacteraceae bacterium]|nr:glycosyltransferase family 87 protein [Steroidobacteraceae bacterium]